MSLPLPDHFAVLGVPRRPWLDPADLRARYHARAAQAHPDSGGAPEDFAAITASFNILQDPAARLKHLLQLEFPGAESSADAAIPPALGEHFMRIAGARQRAVAFLKRYEAETSPLARALLEPERASEKRALDETLVDLDSAAQRNLEELQSADLAWVGPNERNFPALAALQQKLALLARWTASLREPALRLDI